MLYLFLFLVLQKPFLFPWYMKLVLLKNIKKKVRKKIKFTGFVVGGENIYLSSSNGRLFIVNISTGKVSDVLKIDNEKITRPLIHKNNLYITKNNSVIKLN